MQKIEITKRILFLTAIVSDIIERLDELEGTKIYRHEFKKYCKLFINEIEKPLDTIYYNIDGEAMQQGFDINDEVNYNINSTLEKYYSKVDIKGVKIDDLIVINNLVEIISENTKLIQNRNNVFTSKIPKIGNSLRLEINKIFNDCNKITFNLIDNQNRVLGYNIKNNIRGLFTLFSLNLDKELKEKL